MSEINLEHHGIHPDDIEWEPTDLQVKEAKATAAQIEQTYMDANRYEDALDRDAWCP